MDRCFWSIFTGVLVLTFAQMTMADSLSLRCEGELIEEGDTTYEVSSRCGQPDHKQIHYEERYHEKPNTYVVRKRKDTSWTSPFLVKKIIKIETWTYNFGPTRFIYYLFFEDGELVNIETGDYGFPEK
jgi:hypothetical protein